MPQIRLRLDPWPGDYESPLQIEEFEEDRYAKIETDVEGIPWRPVDPQLGVWPDVIHFVDGVRRVEARAVAEDGSQRINYALLGSIAAGAVRAERGKASFEELRVKRYIVAGGGVSPEVQLVRVGNSELRFEPHSVDDETLQAPVFALQYLMRTEEAELAQQLASQTVCVFADGPLTYFSAAHTATVGVVKRLLRPYLSVSRFSLVSELRVGQRTPLFSITEGKYDRYSWYLRVGAPRVMDHTVAGVLRLEVRTGVGVERAVELANLSAGCLPAFVAESYRDPRSPQNLLPIGALEQQLRHRLGDPIAIRRAIEQTLFNLSAV